MSAKPHPHIEERFYAALTRRDVEFEGVFVVGVRTTGVFCRPGCPARAPRRGNCEFFPDATHALAAGYRPCLRCRPLLPPDAASDVVRRLTEAVERQPGRRWCDADLGALGIRAETARRQFRSRFGMTFAEYVRAKRAATAENRIRSGGSVIEAQLEVGYRSGSGFRDAFRRLLGTPPARGAARTLVASWFDTPLGPMIAVGNEQAVHLVEFADRGGLDRELVRLRLRTGAGIVPGRSGPLARLEVELTAYFQGEPVRFSTPRNHGGTAFQIAVWEAVLAIPPGETRTYADVARAIGRPGAIRAVARANGANAFAIVVPCHRVVNSNGWPGGYGGGLQRKRWLLEHERRLAARAVLTS